MKQTDLEKFIHDNLLAGGDSCWEQNEFGVIKAIIPQGGECNLTYVIADVIRAYNKELVLSLGEPFQAGECLSGNGYDLEPNNEKVWYLTHKHVQSGEPFEQFLNSEPINK